MKWFSFLIVCSSLTASSPAAEKPAAARAEKKTAHTQLKAALTKMSSGTWEVNGTIAGPKSLEVQGFFNGRDFDLTYKSADGEPPARQIAIKAKSWLSKDGGKTWKSVSSDDRFIYNLIHTPLLLDGLPPDFEEAGREEKGSDRWLHVQLKVEEKAGEADIPHYWLALDDAGNATDVRRHHGFIYVSKDSVIACKLNYAPARDKRIEKPADVK